MENFQSLTSQLVKPAYAKQGIQNMRTRQKQLEILLAQKKIPKTGLSDTSIEYVMSELSIMDSNNFESNCGVGEREGRVYSSLVSRRHYSLSHGIGRSGNITEEQPKAAGSSIIYKLSTCMAAHALELAGFNKPVHCLVLPFATGMTLTMCMLNMRATNSTAKYVIWSRIDQKSCFKSILTAGLTPLVVDNNNVNGQMQTNLLRIKELLEKHGTDVLCVLSTTSCFAPRQPDLVDEIAKLCKKHNVGHLINNAYGLQCPYISKLINRATVVGQVDAVIQSTDKNFMVPVGGAIVSSPDTKVITELGKLYPGRASISPILDLFITLLSMGENGLLELWKERQKLFISLKEKLQVFADSHGEKILISPANSISIGMTLETLGRPKEGQKRNEITENTNSEQSSELQLNDWKIEERIIDIDGVGDITSRKEKDVLPLLSITPDTSQLENSPDIAIGLDNDQNTVNVAEHSAISSSVRKEDSVEIKGTSAGCEKVMCVLEDDVSPRKEVLTGTIDGSSSSRGGNDTVDGKISSENFKTMESVSFLGSMLFHRNVSGCRVVQQSDSSTFINGVEFVSWGAHTSHYPVSYFTAACSVGVTESEINLFLERLSKVWKQYDKDKVKTCEANKNSS